jgi:MoaA/NifB/PqqE/SkfB family radical SAM enzyme
VAQQTQVPARVRALVPRRARARLSSARVRAKHVVPPPTPAGVKLELTSHCNLRCGFCYTDSPRHTLARTPDMADDAWLGIVEQALDLGVVEAVVTGGEPLLRRELTLEVLSRLTGAGVGVVLNTNGWFVDEQVADRLALADGLRVYVSVDGAAPSLHDSARGVPGSWRRATQAVHLLLERGVTVQVAHVLTPDNASHLPDFMAAMAELGVRMVAVAPVQQIGAAARSGRWAVERRAAEHAVRTFLKKEGDRIEVRLRGEVADSIESYDSRVPRAMLVRPNGSVRLESITPFVFGHALRDGLDACWDQVRTRWNDPEITRWAKRTSRAEPHRAGLVAYRDGDVALASAGGGSVAALAPDAPAPSAVAQAAPTRGEIAEARADLARLATSRRYRLGDVRSGADLNGGRLVRVRDTVATIRLNRSAGAVMDACADGTLGDAHAALVASYPGVDPSRLARDAAASLARLLDARVLRPALAP